LRLRAAGRRAGRKGYGEQHGSNVHVVSSTNRNL
jgi:hypothetical protein